MSFITVDPLNELDDQYSVTLEKSDSQKLLDLLKQDIAEASPQELIGSRVDRWSFTLLPMQIWMSILHRNPMQK